MWANGINYQAKSYAYELTGQIEQHIDTKVRKKLKCEILIKIAFVYIKFFSR